MKKSRKSLESLLKFLEKKRVTGWTLRILMKKSMLDDWQIDQIENIFQESLVNSKKIK